MDGLKNEKVSEKVKKLMSFDKEKLAEEVIKTMMNLHSARKERDEMEAELVTFKEEEKARYAIFM